MAVISNVLKITGFGFSRELVHGSEPWANPALAGETLAYLSPEQTGRMNRGVDYRTDFYSLGATLYELLTGAPPFAFQDPIDMIHAHIAKNPVPPDQLRADLPAVVSDIVLKLLSKATADRYQSGFGLAADGRQCLEQLRASGRIAPFILGAQDLSSEVILPHRLVGRDQERTRLGNFFERVRQGAVELLLVTGEPGIGKSALVDELHASLGAGRGYFIAGKFDAFHRVAPYSALIQAFKDLTRQLLAESDERLRHFRKRLGRALGPNGKIITDAIPEIELIIGPQPDIPALSPEQTRNRFDLCFQNFVRVFADADHPLVLFLDDLQWADSASLHLVERIATDRSVHHLLLVGAYRETGIGSQHPLMQSRAAIQSAGIALHALHVAALDAEHINALLAGGLHCPPERSQPLAQAVYAKTKGNPFFIRQFLRTLVDQRLLSRDAAQGWRWDLDRIMALQATDNVVQFMADKLHELPPPALQLIQRCACIGNHFDLETLAAISEAALDEILAMLDILAQAGLVHRMQERYLFTDDRIQEAAYSLLSSVEREYAHDRIGHLYLRQTTPDELIQRIFYICDQLNRSNTHTAAPGERVRLAELNLAAGIKAKRSAAYAAAVDYLVKGCALLSQESWRNHYDLSYALYSEQMECQYLNRNFEEAERLFTTLIAHSASRRDQARAYHIMIVLYTNLRSPKEAVDLGLKALTLFGIHLSADMGKLGVLNDLIWVKRRIDKLGVEQAVNLPAMEDPDQNACIDLLFITGTPAYFYNQNLMAKLALRGMRIMLRQHRTMPYAASGNIALATIIQTALGDYALGYRLGEAALKLYERFNDRKTAGMIHHTFAFFILHWQRHARHSLDYYRQAYQLSLDGGDFIYAGHSINAAIDCRLMIGLPLDDILAENHRHRELMTVVKDPFIAMRHLENQQFILALKGQTADRCSLSGPGYDEAGHFRKLREVKNIFGLCYALLYKLKILYWFGQWGRARETAAELQGCIQVQMGTLITAEHCFYYALILTALMNAGRSKPAYRLTLSKLLRKLRQWAAVCPDNFQHKYDLVMAERLRVKGRTMAAVRHYHAAIEGARRNGYLHEEALACERLALFYQATSAREEFRLFLDRARRCYLAWGATAKADQLAEICPERRDAPGKSGAGEPPGLSAQVQDTARSLDLSMVLQVSQVISKEIALDRLLRETMHLCMANAGAQRGYLLLETEGRLCVQASENMDTGQQQVLQAVALDECDGLSPAIVNYVHHSGQHVIVGNALAEGVFRNDPHVLRRGCKSILCLPILNKGTVSSILYMENNLTADAFTPERLEILRVITSQAAISLQNAWLYQDLSNEICVRKQAEAALRASEEKHRTILEEMQDAYCEMDLKGRLTFINPAAWTITGYSREELLGKDIRRLSPAPALKGIAHYFQEILSTGRPGKPFGCNLIAKNGDTLFLEIVSSLVRDKAGRPCGFRNVGRDVGERKRLENDLFQSYKNVQTARTATILGLAKLAEYRDEDTGTHLERIREYARIIAQELARQPQYRGYITREYIEDIYNSSILHDIGKVGVPDAILLKPGKLTREEFEIIKTHATLGGDALREVETQIEGQTFLTLGKEIAYFHHEKWDGSGYPKGLKGEKIPLSARIVALADVYDALTSKRIYKEAFSHRQALEIIVKDRGTHFAPDVVDAFMTHEAAFRRIREALHGTQVERRRAS
jgi:PAS domain S-box-containing protein